ncbi:hypothetical protein [Rhodococcus spelaei]|uniref:hypothetical protein n=1 Tax=Rhodococcus spelaei TaxID=2546320 RepID=UPI00338D413D
MRVADLREAGMSGYAIDARCRSGGPWQRILPGLILLHNGIPTQRQRRSAALRYCGADAVLTGRAALAEHGYLSSEAAGDVHVLIPHARRLQSMDFLTVERSARMPNPVQLGSLACAPITRALLDAARRITDIRTVRALISEVVQRGDATPSDLLAELNFGSRRGTALPRKVLEEVGENAHSVAEIDAFELWKRSGLPLMLPNKIVEDSRGRFLARPDGWFDDVALAWEIDSHDWHLGAEEHDHTLKRRATMQSAGIVVMATLPSHLRLEPGRIIDNLRDHYELARSRPRPNVRIRPDTPG